MNAQDLPLTSLLKGPKQFVVPIFQRSYGWGTQHCERLFEDILRVGSDESQQGHFIGSVVYIADENHSADIPRWQLIDGQQRLTTLTLLLLALSEKVSEQPDIVPGVTVDMIEDYYLKNRHGKREMRYKILLTRADQDTLNALLDRGRLIGPASDAIVTNSEYLRQRLTKVDIEKVYAGFKKLMIVSVALSRASDDPQMIFESLNSTGMDLSQADLIRNFALMRQPPDKQEELYETLWYPMDQQFGKHFVTEFDRFTRDYLTLRTEPPRPIRMDDVYVEYKRFFHRSMTGGEAVEVVLKDLKEMADYTRFSLANEPDPCMKEPFSHLHQLIEVAGPFAMRLYELYVKQKLSRDDFIGAVSLAESYVFRRSVCDMQTRSLGQIFALLAYAIQEKNPLESLKVAFARFSKNRRFPSDTEFRQSLLTRDTYGMRNCRFLLDRLENDSRERVDTSGLTIEHVMPQNPNLCPEWREALGENWRETHEKYLHRLGNLTLTGYNERYSDLPFQRKKTIDGGFDNSPLRLNRFIREQATWNQKLIEERGRQLADHAVRLWAPLEIDRKIVQAYELEERKQRAGGRSLDDVDGLKGKIRVLFDSMDQRIDDMGIGITRILSPKNVTYYVYEYFAQIIPRANSLGVLLNLDFEDVVDESGFCRDASRQSFVVHASVEAGVILDVWSDDDVSAAIPYIRQAYERASG